jgi:putative DNA primase/helicase
MFKALTGEDTIFAERKNKPIFCFRPFARLLFSCNDIPKNINDRSEGFYRRLIIIRFSKSVPPEKRDPNLREKLALEADGILMWALAGLRRIMSNNYVFGETDRTREELQRYRIDSNSALLFMEECAEFGEGFECFRSDVYDAYQEFCRNNGYKPFSQIRFNKDLAESDVGIVQARDAITRRHTWRGVKICVED